MNLCLAEVRSQIVRNEARCLSYVYLESLGQAMGHIKVVVVLDSINLSLAHVRRQIVRDEAMSLNHVFLKPLDQATG